MKKLLPFLLFAALLTSCISDKGEVEDNKKPITVQENMVEQGVVFVRFKPEVVDEMTIETRGGAIATNIDKLNELAAQLGASELKRIFPEAGRYEKRQREFGLHLWYQMKFNEDVSVTRAVNSVNDLDVIDIVEAVPIIKRNNQFVVVDIPEVDASEKLQSTHPSQFNDPMINQQWHYYNNGSNIGSKVGADINVVPAWKITTGHPDVIVCVVDGGIDLNHPDIKKNVWVNEAELNGSPGVDDDDNGKIDDKYGWNFYDDNNSYKGDDHGTHVAGTIAAINNNGVGVAGVAGGDGTPGTGVRVMNAQCSDHSGDYLGGTLEGIVYGANNGAVISQNSWGGGNGAIPASYKTAIDYFIKNAGIDPDTKKQVGPMKGGVVIFSAGNSDLSTPHIPGGYAPVVSVASMTHSFRKAWYSNYGTWVSVTAPGGETVSMDEYGVLSTLTGNKYGYYQGTSMACPHVSGIAALVVSEAIKYTDQFTNEELRDILVKAVNDIDQYNPSKVGRMGSGYVDAYKALKMVQELYGNPELNKDIENIYFSKIGEWRILNFNNYVNNSDLFSYKLEADNPDLIDIEELSKGEYKITSRMYGITEFTLTVSNTRNSIDVKFYTIMRDNNQEIELYPNPVQDILNIRVGAGFDEDMLVTIYNTRGVKVLSEKVRVTSAKPGQLNLKNYSSGIYTVGVEFQNKYIRKNITKL